MKNIYVRALNSLDRFPNLSLSLSLSLVDATISTKAHLYSLFLNRVVVAIHRAAQDKRNLLFFSRTEGVNSPRAFFSPKNAAAGKKEKDTKNKTRF